MSAEFSDDELLPISALQHFTYCSRQVALIHLERAWADNRFTAEGNALHKKAHGAEDESRSGIRITRSLPVSSHELGLFGQCDIVEFHKNGDVFPIEYKRGKPKAHRADEVQLCAQGLCLEAMLDRTIEFGFIFYGQKKRRKEIAFDETLRRLTKQTAAALHELIASRNTPIAFYESRKCDSCSLINLCEPRGLNRLKKGAAAWFEARLSALHGRVD